MIEIVHTYSFTVACVPGEERNVEDKKKVWQQQKQRNLPPTANITDTSKNKEFEVSRWCVSVTPPYV